MDQVVMLFCFTHFQVAHQPLLHTLISICMYVCVHVSDCGIVLSIRDHSFCYLVFLFYLNYCFYCRICSKKSIICQSDHYDFFN